MPQNHFREPKNRREHLLSSLPIVLPVAAVTISAAAFGLLFLQGNPVESVEESLTYTAAIGAADEQVEMYVSTTRATMKLRKPKKKLRK